MNNSRVLINKTILVTGASSGIGRCISIDCAKAGAKLILTGRDPQKLRETLNALEGTGHEMIGGDLADAGFIDSLCEQLPLLDGMVYSAGLMKLLPLKFIKADDIDEIYSINLRAPVLLIARVSKLKKLRRASSVVLISSVSGTVIGNIGHSIYSATKGGLQAFCKSASLELAKNEVRINCIAPGMVETEGMDRIGEQVSAEGIESDKKKYPLSRYGKPSDIASAALFLLGDASAWITGTNMVIDGGYTVQ